MKGSLDLKNSNKRFLQIELKKEENLKDENLPGQASLTIQLEEIFDKMEQKHSP